MMISTISTANNYTIWIFPFIKKLFAIFDDIVFDIYSVNSICCNCSKKKTPHTHNVFCVNNNNNPKIKRKKYQKKTDKTNYERQLNTNTDSLIELLTDLIRLQMNKIIFGTHTIC